MRTKSKYIIGSIVICIILAIVVFPAQAFRVDHLDYSISANGDAVVSADYELTFIEKIALMVPTIKDEVSKAIKTEYGEKSEIIMMNETRAQFTIPGFADKYPTYIQTPSLNFSRIQARVDAYWFIKALNIDYSPTVTTIRFFDGTVHTYNDVMFIPALTLILK